MKQRHFHFRFLHRLAASCVALAVVSGFSAGVLAQTPVAHWTFEEGLNNYDLTVVPDAANSNDATWQDTDTDGLSYTIGQIGGAVRMGGGTDQYFTATVPELADIVATPPFDPPTPGVGLTVMGWINADAPGGNIYKGILVTRQATDVRYDATLGEVTDTNQNWGIALEGNASSLHTDTRVSGIPVDSPDDSIVTGTWHHLAMVWGNTPLDSVNASQEVYVDGQMVASSTPIGTSDQIFEFITGGTWLLGEDSCCPGREFDGLLDDLALFDSALTAAEIEGIYDDGLVGIDASGTNTGIIGPGDVDGMNGTTIEDFNIIRDNLGRDVNARNLGDLDGSRKVDLNDFQIWLDSVPPGLAAQASGSVPEPSTALLGGLLVVCGLFRGRTRRSKHHL